MGGGGGGEGGRGRGEGEGGRGGGGEGEGGRGGGGVSRRMYPIPPPGIYVGMAVRTSFFPTPTKNPA